MTATLTILVSFNGADGDEPRAGLIADAAGDLFGTTEVGGATNSGMVFEIAKTPTGYASTATVLASFNGFDGSLPSGGLLADAEGDLFGTTAFGGPAGLGMGTVFELVKTPTGYANPPGTVVDFTGDNGLEPTGDLIADAAGDLFGTAEDGGASNDGTVFEITRTGDSSTLISFNGADGQGPGGSLIVDAKGDLFGTTAGGGANNGGTVFEIAKTPTGYASMPTTLVSFAEDTGTAAGLVMDANGDLFSTTSGTVFEVVKTATGYASTPTTLVSFDPRPLWVGGLIMDANGNLFGMTDGTLLNKGTVFEIKRTASGYANTPTTLVSFNSLDHPQGSLIADSHGDLFGTTESGGANGEGTVFEITDSGFVPGGPAKPPPASDGILFPPNRLTTLVSFNGADSSNPRGDLIADSSGNLFGTTADGGVGTPANPANGAVFEIVKTPTGYASTPTTLVSFTLSTDAPQTPVAGLLVDSNGDLFGTTEFGGTNGGGTVFEIKKTAAGYASTPTTLVSFGGTDGVGLKGSLIADSNGDLFGTTTETVFEIAKTAAGYATTPTTLFNFNQANGDFGNPGAGLLTDSNGDLFGTTDLGGQFDDGTVFEIKKTATGYASTPTTLVSFTGEDGQGEIPEAGLIADSRGDLFGTTSTGGAVLHLGGGGFALGAGTVFEIVKTAAGYAGTPITLATFHDLSDGLSPEGRLIIDANDDLFGTTSGIDPLAGTGAAGELPATPGTVFEIKKTAAGYASTPTTLVAFNGADGATPVAGLLADASGDLFGTTSGGTPDILSHDRGTVFEVTDSGFVTTASATPASDGILFQNASGQAAIWGIDGTKRIAGATVNPNPGPGWKEIGTGDFNADGLPDLLWQNASTGQAAIWEMDGTTRIGGGAVSLNPGPTWAAVGTGDFNGDGLSDILWQNTSTGQASIWEMSGNTRTGGGAVSANPGPTWRAVGTGDFNGDGDSDILWQNANGQVSVWEMDGNTRIGGGAVSLNPGPAWHAIGTGDFNHDGLSDILFQNMGTGQVSIWEMDGTTRIGGGAVSAIPGPSWHAIGTGGGSDILFQNTSGQISIWEMDGNTRIGGGAVSANPGPSWRAVDLT
jgi:uncharacterized repeat protein (TIGR03803 family)